MISLAILQVKMHIFWMTVILDSSFVSALVYPALPPVILDREVLTGCTKFVFRSTVVTSI